MLFIRFKNISRLISKKSFEVYLKHLNSFLGILEVEHHLHKEIINQYLFNNTWQHWKSLHYERPKIFRKYWLLENKESIEVHDRNQEVIIFLYKHTPLSDQHLSLIQLGFGMRFVGLGNTHSKRFLTLNGQNGLPREVVNNPHKHPRVVRNHQLRKILSVLKSSSIKNTN